MNLKRYIVFAVALGCAVVSRAITLEPGNFRIVMPANSPEPEMLAARSVARDFGKVMHWIPDIDSVASAGMTNIRVVDAAVAGERGIRSLDGFESHRIYVDGDDIVLAGKDMRGAI